MSDGAKNVTIIVLALLLVASWGLQILNDQARKREERAAYQVCLQSARTQADLTACSIAFPRQG